MMDAHLQSRLETELREVKERFARFSDASVDGIIVHAMGRIIDVNRTGAEMLGYDPSEIIGLAPTELTVPEQRAIVLAHIASGSEAPLEGLGLRKDGTVFPLEIRGRTLSTTDTAARIVIVHDISERVRAEEALRDTALQLQQSQKLDAVGRLAGGIAHDFNNLLTVISSFTQMVAESFSTADPRREDLQEVQAAAARAATLTRQLLAFSRTQLMEPAVVDLNNVVRDLEKMLARIIGDDVRLETRTGSAPVSVLADRGQVEQVLVNLVVNARDAMPDGGTVTITSALDDLDEPFVRRVLSADASPGRYARIDVRDSGIGMDSHVQAHIFEPFFTTKPAGLGTGLGLSTVYGIVKQSGGFINVESTLGTGSTFSIFFREHSIDAALAELR